MANIEAAYRSGEGSALAVNKAFYDSLKEGGAKRTLVESKRAVNHT